MTILIEHMKKVLASTFVMYMKAHAFHWNVEGPNFVQYHSFFDTLYNELWGAIDPIAEHIRAIDAYAPMGLDRFKELSTLGDAPNTILAPENMFKVLLNDNALLLELLKKTQKIAEQEGQVGLANFLQDRHDIHCKHNWMLKAVSK